MFFWKWTRSGRVSKNYVSLILDFHDSNINDHFLNLSFEECEDILCLMHDVEVFNMSINSNAGIKQPSFSNVVSQLGYSTTDNYSIQRNKRNLVIGQMTLGTHSGSPLDYGKSNKKGVKCINIDINQLKYSEMISAETGHLWGNEDKLRAYRSDKQFINSGKYYDLMPLHNCMIEFITKMKEYDLDRTTAFIIDVLKWV